MTQISIEVDSREVVQAFNRAPGIVISKLSGWVNRTASTSERYAKTHITDDVSRGSSGVTRASIHTVGLGALNKEVKPTNKYAYYVHEGRDPGRMPPFSEGTSLAGWARRMGMNPFLVARSIGRHGTKGHPFMNEAYRDVKPYADRDAQSTLADIVSSI